MSNIKRSRSVAHQVKLGTEGLHVVKEFEECFGVFPKLRFRTFASG
jgi:hypothetical protein